MKKIFTILLFIVYLQTLKAQTYVTIPDANFVTWLQANIPSAMVGNQMDITSAAVMTRTIIEVENLGINDLDGVQYFTSLKILDCGNGSLSLNPNSFVSLPALPVTLDSLICGRTSLSILPILPGSLKLLKCYSNNLSSLPALPNTLIHLDCSYNQLNTIPSLPGTLRHFYCSFNQLSSIPTLPGSLINFACDYNSSLSSLPTLPNTIELLNCGNCQLSSLPALPSNLKELYCGYNPITILPILPNNLESLWCPGNQLTNLPSLPLTLKVLDCWDNYLTSLPSIVNCPLWALWCFDNQLTSLPVLPSTLLSLKCENNNISCFPLFDHIYSEIGIAGNPFTCLPNYNGAMDAATLNYPLCVSGNTVTNPHGCPDANGIVGFTYKDNNNSCTKDAGDTGLKNIPVSIYNNSGSFLSQTYTALNGVYQFLQTNNTYTIVVDTAGMPFTTSCVYPGLDSTVTVALLDTNINFALTCKPGFDLGVQSVYTNGIILPGQTHVLNLNAGDLSHWYNLNCASGISGVLSFTVSGPVTYVGPAAGALTPNVTGNVYTYTIADFGTINNNSDFRLVFQTNTTAQAGDAICIDAMVTPINGDNDPVNNTYQYCYPVVNSCDPNIKEVYPVVVQSNFSDWLTYTVHFQNTGNAAAINIRLTDVLDTKLNTESFEVINYSHDNLIDLTGNSLTVRFPNIQLADSTSNPEGSKGFIQYRIKPKTNWVTDTIKNTASIYFDFNAPIVTNTAKSYFMTSTGVKEQLLSGFNVYPNPTSSVISVKLAGNSLPINTYTLKIVDIIGKEAININYKEQIDVSFLEKGIYFLSVYQGERLIGTKKVVKE